MATKKTGGSTKNGRDSSGKRLGIKNISNGMVKIEDTPGWGIEINPDWLDKSEYKKTEI